MFGNPRSRSYSFPKLHLPEVKLLSQSIIWGITKTYDLDQNVRFCDPKRTIFDPKRTILKTYDFCTKTYDAGSVRFSRAFRPRCSKTFDLISKTYDLISKVYDLKPKRTIPEQKRTMFNFCYEIG